MTPLLIELDVLVTQGLALAGSAELETAQLQDWLNQRGRLLSEIDLATGQLGGAERNTLASSIQAILQLDATIIPRVETAMREVGEELAGVRKIKSFLASGVKPAAHSLLRRAL